MDKRVLNPYAVVMTDFNNDKLNATCACAPDKGVEPFMIIGDYKFSKDDAQEVARTIASLAYGLELPMDGQIVDDPSTQYFIGGEENCKIKLWYRVEDDYAYSITLGIRKGKKLINHVLTKEDAESMAVALLEYAAHIDEFNVGD